MKRYVEQEPRLSFDVAGQGRGISAGSTLGDVEEESDAEGWTEEVQIRGLIQKTTEDLEQMAAEKDEMINEPEKGGSGERVPDIIGERVKENSPRPDQERGENLQNRTRPCN